MYYKLSYYIKRIILMVSLFLFISESGHCQFRVGFGASGLHTTYNNEFGLSGRVLIPVRKNLYAVPYGYYYFTNNDYSFGLSAMAPFYSLSIFTFYAIAAGSFNGSAKLTVNNTSIGQEKSIKANGEAGFGMLIGRKCLKGFIEPRYETLHNDISTRVGLVYICGINTQKGSFGKSSASASATVKRKKPKPKKRKKNTCPAYY